MIGPENFFRFSLPKEPTFYIKNKLCQYSFVMKFAGTLSFVYKAL
jgi:hypothetical protein